jgi:ribosome-associated protein
MKAVKLDQYLKWHGLAATGGEAKQRIQRGDVKVNGAIEIRRGRHLAPGDAVEIDGRERIVMPPAAEAAGLEAPDRLPPSGGLSETPAARGAQGWWVRTRF